MFYKNIGKKVFDLTLAFVLLPFLLLPIVIITLILLFVQGKPIIYKGKRTGYRGKEFYLYKFRTMSLNQEKVGGDTTALNDPRITFLGKYLRKFKADELPQIFNILKGEMSFVGPRPELPFYTNQYNSAQKEILSVKPGITDYFSVEYSSLDKAAGENSDETFENHILPIKNSKRLNYIKSISFKTDILILLRTLLVIFQKILGKESIRDNDFKA
jgi:lipopolysaccharide/colanic/teichoic acid biosynthesis glycosyltransferase